MTTRKKALEVHPVADLFPMLPDDELADLATDIGERGLLQPIVLDSEGRILDGRNRYAACQIVGIEPTFSTYAGDDADGYALAVNIARRHMTKGQQAIVVAKACLVSKQSVRDAAKSQKLSPGRIAQANVILKHAPDLTESVMAGTSFDEAYTKAAERKKQADAEAKGLAGLRREAPDLADQVVEERLSLAEALGAKREREKEAKAAAERERKARSDLYSGIAQALSTVGVYGGYSDIESLMSEYNATELDPPQLDRHLDLPNRQAAQRFVEQLIEWRKGYVH